MMRLGWRLLTALNLLTLAVLFLPLAISVLVSFSPSELIALPDRLSMRWYREFFDDWQWIEALWNTLAVAALTIVISFPIGLLAALAYMRLAHRWRSALNVAILLPLFVPPVVIGLGALVFHRSIGIWGTHVSIALAHSLWAMPLVFIVLRTTLRGVDSSLEEAAAGLGASPVRVFFEITFPLIASGVAVGVLFAFIISVNEFIMALFLANSTTKTLPVVIWPKVRYLLTPIVAAASSLVIAITLVLLVVSARLLGLRRLVDAR